MKIPKAPGQTGEKRLNLLGVIVGVVALCAMAAPMVILGWNLWTAGGPP